MSPAPRQNGFTLLEVLIAATLLAVMMTLLLGSLRIGIRSWEGGERRTATMSRMLTTQNFLRSHLSSALPLKPSAGPGEEPDAAGPTIAFEGGSERLSYVGALPPQVRGGLYRFELYVAERAGLRDLKLAIRPMHASAGAGGRDGANIEDVTLVENLVSLRIAYLAQPLAGQPAEWQSEWRQPLLPALVRIEIVPHGDAPWPTLTIAPRNEGRQ